MSTRNGSPAISPDEREDGIGPGQLEQETGASAENFLHETIPAPNWVANTSLLWLKRRILFRTAGISLVIALAIAFLWPKQYESSARILPPANSMGGAAMLAALAGRSAGSLGALGALAGGFLGGGGNTPLFVDLLRSGSIAGQLIDRFDLQRVYGKRYRVDAAKALARRTKVVDDKKSGVITITVTDTDPVRARDMAQAYLDELNRLVNRTSTSSARQERLFIEERLRGVKGDLDQAQQRLSEFSSTHSTIDIKEQTRAMVDAASRLQSQLIVEQSGLDSLRQTYGDENIRVRSAQARIAGLQAEIAKISGSSQALPAEVSGTGSSQPDTGGASAGSGNDLYPPLRQLPRLAVPYANLYREVRVQEGVYELLTQQYELARIQEAKDVPVVSVIDSPGIPEKKSFPPRLLMAFLLMAASVAAASLLLLMQRQWLHVPASDPRKVLANEIGRSVHRRLAFWAPRAKGVQ